MTTTRTIPADPSCPHCGGRGGYPGDGPCGCVHPEWEEAQCAVEGRHYDEQLAAFEMMGDEAAEVRALEAVEHLIESGELDEEIEAEIERAASERRREYARLRREGERQVALRAMRRVS